MHTWSVELDNARVVALLDQVTVVSTVHIDNIAVFGVEPCCES
jgi:hypothetical protein